MNIQTQNKIFQAGLRILAKTQYLSQANFERNLWMTYRYMSLYDKYATCECRAKAMKDRVPQNTIWAYWQQGEDHAPEVVKRCLASLRKQTTLMRGGNLIILNDLTIHQYIQLPDIIERKHRQGIISHTLYSDLLRLALLTEYGGMWCDATCLWTTPLPKEIAESDFFMFQGSKFRRNVSTADISTWFIKSEPHNPLLEKTRNVLYNYFLHHDILPHYFVFHIVLCRLKDHDPALTAIWDNMPVFINENPHIMQYSWDKAYNPTRWEQLRQNSFIHKLTYKYDKALETASPGNILMRILQKEM